MVAVLALAAFSQQADPNSQAWLSALRTVARVERASLCVDVDESVRPAALLYERPDGERGLDRVAVALGRSRSVVEGVQVFSRRLDADGMSRYTAHEHAMGFLKSLGVTETSRLSQGTLDFSSLPSPVQARLRYAIATLGNGLGDSMLAQYPDRIGMRLVFEPVATVRAQTNDGTVTLMLLPEKTPVPVPPATQVRAVDPLGRPLDGALDFQDGSILSLREIMDRAEITFGKAFSYDRRLSQTRYFVSGTFTEPRFLKVIEAVTLPMPVEPLYPFVPVDFSDDKLNLVTMAFAPLAEQKIGVGDLTYNDLIHGKVTTFQFIYGPRPPRPVQVFMAQYRIEMTDEVQVSGDLYLAIAAPGLALLDTGELDAIGRPVPYSVPHFLKIAF